MYAPEALERVAAASEATIRTGRTAPGRGAWLCSAGCFEAAVKRGALARALRCEVTSTDVERLRATLFPGT